MMLKRYRFVVLLLLYLLLCFGVGGGGGVLVGYPSGCFVCAVFAWT